MSEVGVSILVFMRAEHSVLFKRPRCVVLFLLLMGVPLLTLTCEGPKRYFTVADDISLAHFGDPYTGQAAAITFAPNGEYFVVDTERGVLDQNRPESTLSIFRTEDVRQSLLRSDKSGEPSPFWVLRRSTYKDGPIITRIRWLGDGSGVAFLVKTESGNDRLFLADLKTKTVEPMTAEDQQVTGFDIRSRNQVAYTVPSPAIREKAMRDNGATALIATGHDLYTLLFPQNLSLISKTHDLNELWAVVNGRRFRVEDKEMGQPIHLHWAGQRALCLSPDGRYVVTAMPVATVPSEWQKRYPPPLGLDDPHRITVGQQDVRAFDGTRFVSSYVVVDLLLGRVTPLTEAPIGEAAGWWSANLTAEWSSDSKVVVLSNTFLQPNGHGSSPLEARPCVAVVDLVEAAPNCVDYLKGKTSNGYEVGYHYIQNVRFVDGDRRRVKVEYLKLSGEKESKAFSLSDRRSWTIAAATKGWAGQDSRIAIGIRESFTSPPVLMATDEANKSSRVILDPNPSLRDVDLGAASVFEWKDSSGRDWIGGLYKPPNIAPGQRYPLVVQTHGFAQFRFEPSGIFPTANAARELAAIGILVLQVPDCPTTVDSKESQCNVSGYESGVRALIAQGLVDPDRVGIVGFSRTCYYVLDALTTGSIKFRAASITDGINLGYLQYMISVDLRSNGLAHEADVIIGAPPFGNGLQLWLNRSPEFNMDKVATPLQVVALGRPDVLAMWEPYAALRYLQKPVELLVLPEGSHVLTNPAARMASQGGSVDWFRFWLKGEEDPAPDKLEQNVRWRELRKLQEASEHASKHQ